MGKLSLAVALFLLYGCSLRAFAQARVQAAVFLDSTTISQTNTNEVGLGVRAGYRVHRNVMAEGEFAYTFGVNFTETYINIANGNVSALEKTSIGDTDLLFGPMLQPAHGHLRPFVTLKGGFIDFRLSPSLIPYSGVVSSIVSIRTSRLSPMLYPAGGAEAVLGPLGLRLEFGDALYFNNGAHNNLRVTFGPVLRF